MSERLEAAIEEIEAQIKAKEAEIAPLKIAVNSLCHVKGEGPRYKIDGQGAPGQPKTITIKPDQFVGRPLAQCVTEYLEAREAIGIERVGNIDDIFEALSKGGYRFESVTGNEEYNKGAIKRSLTKNTAQFVKISENVFGLKKWYPNIKTPRRTNGNGGGEDEEEQSELTPIPEVNPAAEAPAGEPVK